MFQAIRKKGRKGTKNTALLPEDYEDMDESNSDVEEDADFIKVDRKKQSGHTSIIDRLNKCSPDINWTSINNIEPMNIDDLRLRVNIIFPYTF